MAKKNQAARTNRQSKKEEFVQVDIFQIPVAQAEMYRVLREAIAEETIEIWQAQYAKVERVSDEPEEGEAIVAYNEANEEQVRLYLNPSSLSTAQKARDKDQLDKFLTTLVK